MKFWQIIPMAAVMSLCVLPGCEDTSHTYSIDRKSVDGLPTVVATESSSAKATVEAVDYANRSIALQGPNGVTQIFSVSPMVRNLTQVKKGDTVHVDYATRLAASVRKTTDLPSTTTVDSVQLAELGKKPGIVCTRNARVEATVEMIDYESRKVDLKTTTGAIMHITADKKLQDLENVHRGDQVIFDYAEAIVIQVQ